MERSIEIKRRAQRFILNRDLDGALSEYEKLVASGDSDPYHSVLLADLLYKKGDAQGATRRYLEAVNRVLGELRRAQEGFAVPSSGPLRVYDCPAGPSERHTPAYNCPAHTVDRAASVSERR